MVLVIDAIKNDTGASSVTSVQGAGKKTLDLMCLGEGSLERKMSKNPACYLRQWFDSDRLLHRVDLRWCEAHLRQKLVPVFTGEVTRPVRAAPAAVG